MEFVAQKKKGKFLQPLTIFNSKFATCLEDYYILKMNMQPTSSVDKTLTKDIQQAPLPFKQCNELHYALHAC